MRELRRGAARGEEAWVVGGAVRDELLGRPAGRPRHRLARARARRARLREALRRRAVPALRAARRLAGRARRTGAPSTSRRCRGSIEDDLATRDFTINAIARPLGGGEPVDPFGGQADLEARRLRAVGRDGLQDDPLRLLRAVRLEDELGLPPRRGDRAARARATPRSSARRPASGSWPSCGASRPRAIAGSTGSGCCEPLGGRIDDRLDRWDSPDYRLVAVFGEELRRFPISNELGRYATAAAAGRAAGGRSPASIHRFRRATEPWALEALAFLGAPSWRAAIEGARSSEPAEPLLRGDELGLPPGPEIGRLLAEIEEERAAGTISTKEEALDYARRHSGSVREDG